MAVVIGRVQFLVKGWCFVLGSICIFLIWRAILSYSDEDSSPHQHPKPHKPRTLILGGDNDPEEESGEQHHKWQKSTVGEVRDQCLTREVCIVVLY